MKACAVRTAPNPNCGWHITQPKLRLAQLGYDITPPRTDPRLPPPQYICDAAPPCCCKVLSTAPHSTYTLTVVTWPPLAPWGVPGWLPWLCCLPECKVLSAALLTRLKVSLTL